MSDKKNNSPEIFKGKENEIKQEFEKKGYDWEKVKSELEKIEKKEEIDKKLTELEGKTEDYVTYLEGLLKDKEKLKKTEPEKKGIVDKAVENGKKAVIEEAEKKGNFYGKIARFFLEGTDEKAEDTFFTKVWNGMKVGIGMAILGFFGIKGISTLTEAKKEEIKETVSNAVTSGTEVAVSATERVGESVKSVVTEKVDEVKGNTNDKISQGKEIVGDLTKDKYSSVSLHLLKTLFSPSEKFSSNLDITDLFSRIGNKNFTELAEDFKLMDNNGNMKESGVDVFISKNPDLKIYENQKEDIYLLLKMLVHQKTTGIIFVNSITQNNIENILNETGEEKINFILGEGKFQEIKDKNFDYTKLDIKTILTLVGLNYKGVTLSSLQEGFESGKNILYDTIFGDSNILKNLKEELNNRKENLLPTKVFEVIKGDSGFDLGGSAKVGLKFEEFDTSKLNDLEKEKFKKFLSFRDEVLAEFRNTNSEFSLGMGDKFVQNFNKIINLKEIIYLYFVFDGKSDFLNTSDSMKKMMVYAWLLNKFKSDSELTAFSGEYASKLEENVNRLENFTEEEKILYKILISKFTTNYFKPVIEGASFLEGVARDKIKNILRGTGLSEEYLDEAAIAIEAAGGILAFIIALKTGLIGPFLVVLIPYLAILTISVANDYMKHGLSEENYKEVREVMNDLLKKYNSEVKIKDKNGVEKKIIGDSLETLEQARENVQEVIEKQIKTSAYILLKDGSLKPVLNYKENNYNPKALYIKIFTGVIGDYSFEIGGKSYKIDYDISNGVWSSLKGLVGYENKIDFSKFNNEKFMDEKKLTFGVGSDQKSFTFIEIAEALSKNSEKVIDIEMLKPYYKLGEEFVLKEV